MKSPRRFKATRREALAQWAEAIAQDPNNVEAHHNRGVFHFREENYAAATEDLSRVMELDPSYGEARDFLLRCYKKRGLVYFDMRNDGEALKYFTKAIELSPDSATAYFNRGRIYMRLGDGDRAISDFTQIIHPKSKDLLPFFWRGLAYFAKGDDARAIEDFTDA